MPLEYVLAAGDGLFTHGVTSPPCCPLFSFPIRGCGAEQPWCKTPLKRAKPRCSVWLSPGIGYIFSYKNVYFIEHVFVLSTVMSIKQKHDSLVLPKV